MWAAGSDSAPALISQEVAQGQHDDAGGQGVHEEPAGQPQSGGNPGQVGQGSVVLLRVA